MDDRKFIPGAYKLSQCIIRNQDGEEIDIKNLVDTIKVTESIYSMFCTYEFVIVDAVAFLEKHGIVGNEKIEVEFVKKDKKDGDDEQVKKYLIATSIKDYAKPVNQAQTYILQAVAEEAMVSTLLKVNRSVKGSFADIISALYSEIEYKMPLNVSDNGAEGNFQGVISDQAYIEAIKFLITRAQDTKGNTYHFFETLWDDMNLSSYTEMIARTPVDKYRLTSEASPKFEDYDEGRTKIRGISSNLGVSNYEAFSRGGFNSRTHVIDIATKTYQYQDFNILKDQIPKMNKDYRATESYTVAGKSFNDFVETKSYTIHKNSLSYGENIDNLNNRLDNISKKRALFTNQYGINHSITLLGDTRLKCGNIVELDIPVSIDPGAVEDHRDEIMSGNYLIFSVQHTFNANGSYNMDLNVKKDSINRELAMSKYRNMRNPNE